MLRGVHAGEKVAVLRGMLQGNGVKLSPWRGTDVHTAILRAGSPPVSRSGAMEPVAVESWHDGHEGHAWFLEYGGTDIYQRVLRVRKRSYFGN